MMGDTSTILNCNLQRYLKKSVFIKHFVIFLSIYTFTFLLNWYALESLVVDGYIDRGQNNEKNNNVQNNNAENNNDDSKNIRKFKQRSLLNYLIYTIFIYTIFILSTKNEGLTLVIFLIGCLVLT